MSNPESQETRQVDPGRAPRLDQLERWMFEVVSHRGGVSAGLEAERARTCLPAGAERLEDIVEPSRSLSAAERLGIYASMYYWRLIDVLVEDYPTVRHLLGADRFYETAAGYVDAHPSTHYSLSRLGRAFPEYLRDEAPDLPVRDFVFEVALLERTIEEVFDAPRSPVLEVDDLLAVPEDRRAELRFRMAPAFGLHAFRYPVDDFYQAVRDEHPPQEAPAPQRSWLAVFRRHFKVWRMPLSEPQHAVLGALASGLPLGAALESALALPGVGAEELLGSLRSWFETWAGEGLFAGVEIG
jgi:hypothetical protein